jgi:hypothetical protein
MGWRAVMAALAATIGLIATRTTLVLFGLDATGRDLVISGSTLVVAVFVVLPVCGVLSLRRGSPRPLDGALCLYLAAEIGMIVVLSRASTGAWINYGIQATVFASVLAARALARTCERMPGRQASWLIALAALTVLIGVCSDVKLTANRRRDSRLLIAEVLSYYGRPGTEFFFVDRPGLNRVHGSLALVYDDWLYPVFEAIHNAQPRSIWLQNALYSSEIRYVVTQSDNVKIEGLSRTLPELGYARGIMAGPTCFVWWRVGLASTPGR